MNMMNLLANMDLYCIKMYRIISHWLKPVAIQMPTTTQQKQTKKEWENPFLF